MKIKSVQIPEELFTMIGNYFLNDRKDDSELESQIIKGLQDKLDRMAMHDIYSKYVNTELSDSDRDAARLEYLEKRGISSDFIWPYGFK